MKLNFGLSNLKDKEIRFEYFAGKQYEGDIHQKNLLKIMNDFETIKLTQTVSGAG